MIHIHNYNKTLLENNPSLVYVGRGKTVEELGLGNPYSHKSSRVARFKVATLEDSINCYRKWLFGLLKAHLQNRVAELDAWERQYLKKVLATRQKIAARQVRGLMCWCVECPNYKPDGSKAYECHAQVLYAAILWLNSQTPQTRKVTPEHITRLEPLQVFVFGSNPQGHHGAGAAHVAFGNYPHKPGVVGRWAVYGTAAGYQKGQQGASYAIITKELREDYPPVTLQEIQTQIDKFLTWAFAHPNLECYVTRIGCGLAGWSDEEIAALFQAQNIPPNVYLPKSFWSFL